MEADKLFIGVIAVRTVSAIAVVEINNEIFVDAGFSEDEIRGRWVRQVKEKYPKSSIDQAGVYDITSFAADFFKNKPHLLTEPKKE